ncbi:MAG: MBL fold metallo-hydrolase [Verrucomicrobiae bacterium]|nr:MBL fold metallo-hydrolase [Verrucomicrobiae bacterium]MDW8344737.1 MBL fold metallo-hydrolase [Verrucomicrobiae bacterium]
MGVTVTILGSGSAGNCTLIETETTALLIDVGLSGRQINDRLAQLGRHLTDLDAIVLTHEHGDHTRALPVLCKQHRLPVYANRLTAEAITDELQSELLIAWHLFTSGTPFSIGDLVIEPFPVPHDACDPVNFLIRHQSHAIGILTDLGHVTRLVVERVRAANLLILEANHDVRLLQNDTARPWSIKQRILSRHGHLSNEAAASLAGEIAGEHLHHVFLAHLSRDCNRPELATRAVGEQLYRRGARHIRLTVATQDAPTTPVTLGT